MAKQKGHRANKPNDNKGTIDNDSLYRNKYREDVYKDDEEVKAKPEEAVDPAEEEQSEAATQEIGESFVENKKDHDYKKRYDDLKRHYDAKVAEWKEKENSVNSSLSNVSKDIRIPQTREEYEDLQRTNPELYNTIESLSNAKTEEKLKNLNKELEDYKGRATKLQREKAYEELLRLQPNFTKLKTNDKFLTWLQEQPSSISDGIYNNSTDAKWASRVVDLYLADSGNQKKEVNKETDAAASVQAPQVREVRTDNKGKKIWKASEIQRMKAWEFEKFEKDIDLARAENRIDYSS
jgi:hypothetical protein|tara:strand:- start:52 stop:933 length:882 start_codon:yes stop_codon:yes gene_type:complete